MGLALISAAGRFMVWLSNDAPACRGLAVVWRVRGVNASDPESGMPATDPFSSPGGGEEPQMAAVMIGVDPHKVSHTAAAIGPDEEPLGQVRMPASVSQAEQLVAWAAGWPERTW